MQRWNNLLFEYNFVLKEKIKIQKTYSKNEIPLKVAREETDYLKNDNVMTENLSFVIIISYRKTTYFEISTYIFILSRRISLKIVLTYSTSLLFFSLEAPPWHKVSCSPE